MTPNPFPPAGQPFLPDLPAPIAGLERLLANVWWVWNVRARALVESIAPGQLDAARGRIAAWSAGVDAGRWAELAADAAFVAELHAVTDALDAYMTSEDTWWNDSFGNDPEAAPGGITYFSAEFGLHEGLPIYSGGLGVLAGDHLKSASDLGIPLMAVGLFYRQGYFRQHTDSGKQSETYEWQTPEQLGMRRAVGAGGQPLEVFVPLYQRYVRAKVWQAQVGRVPLFLLDTDVDGNRPEDRQLTRCLYGGDTRMRICQEMILGVGGLRAVRGLGFDPSVLHMNEGHTAFVVLERMHEEIERGFDVEDALETVQQEAVFTTHTPVPAGHDRFWDELLEDVVGPYRSKLGISAGRLMDMGRVHTGSLGEEFCMTVLALRAARATNGVSEKHGEVSRQMWQELWPGRDCAEVPIGHITNGVHAPTWLGAEVQQWLDSGLDEWRDRLPDEQPWAEVLDLDGGALWNAHEVQKQRLLDFVHARTGTRIEPGTLILGFARRFAPYKRGDMILSDVQRASAMLRDTDRPVALLYAGKAHPRDENGKEIVRRVLQAAGMPEFEGHVVFLEDYDIGVGRMLVQGVDVWINNPRRPREASGTSGQKVSMNGGLNCSTLDGWWIEGFANEPLAGWAVGDLTPDPDLVHGDRLDREALYQALENEVVPMFFDRDEAGVPQEWVKRMKASIATCLPAFNTDRMLADYVRGSYLAD